MSLLRLGVEMRPVRFLLELHIKVLWWFVGQVRHDQFSLDLRLVASFEFWVYAW